MVKRIVEWWLGVALIVCLGMAFSSEAQTAIANNAADMLNKIVMVADSTIPRTVTNLFTFNRSSSAPFAVNSGAAKVSNLDADKVDGYEGSTLLDIGRCDFRLTLTTAVPVTTSDVTAATTVFVTPTSGYQCAVYDGATAWLGRTSTELSFSIAGFAINTNFDVWLYDNAGTLATESLAWSGDTTRATALTTQNGVLVKTGATTRRYLGTFRTTGTLGQTEDSFAKRFVWNYYNRHPRPMRLTDPTNTWNYTLAVIRQANAGTAPTPNQIAFVIGVADTMVEGQVSALAFNASAEGAVIWAIGIGQDSTTTFTSGFLGGYTQNSANNSYQQLTSTLKLLPVAGYHFWSWNEYSSAVGTTTWAGDANTPLLTQSGIHGWIDG